MTNRTFSRRDLLKAAAATALGITIVPRHVLGGPGYTPPSEKLTRAIIGCGSMGRSHLNYQYGPLLALCDADTKHLREALKLAGDKGEKDVKTYTDFREVLERKDIDVVHVVTPPHWHGYMAAAAARSGKDVWCEKPVTRTIGEGLRLIETIRETQRILRINTWFRMENQFYGTGSAVKPLKKLVDSGILGWPLKINIGASTGFDWKYDRWTGIPGLRGEDPIPETLDYDMWLGPAPYKPYKKERVHLEFRGYWDYDGGGLGDMGQHYLDPVQYLLGKDDTSPIFVEADTHEQDFDAVLPFNNIVLRYADGCEIHLDNGPKRKDVPFIEGPKGKLYPGMRCTVPNWERALASAPEPEPMLRDFEEAVKTRKKFALNELNGHRSCTLINLAKIAQRVGRPLHFDPDKQIFINDAQANQLISEPARGPWSF